MASVHLVPQDPGALAALEALAADPEAPLDERRGAFVIRTVSPDEDAAIVLAVNLRRRAGLSRDQVVIARHP